VSESNGGLLAHIIDSRAAARDAPALLCPVERWQEAWFRDNSFLIACLIHTIRNYTAVPCAYARRSRNHSGKQPGTRPLVLFARVVLFPPIFFLFLGIIDFVHSSSLVSLNRCHDLQIKGERYKVEILLTISVFFYERTSIVNRDENIFKYTHTCIYMFIFENDEIASKFAFSGSMMFYRKDREMIVTRISAARRTCARGQARRDETRREARREAAKVKESGDLLMMHGHGHRRILDTNVTPVSSIKLRDSA